MGNDVLRVVNCCFCIKQSLQITQLFVAVRVIYEDSLLILELQAQSFHMFKVVWLVLILSFCVCSLAQNTHAVSCVDSFKGTLRRRIAYIFFGPS